MIYNMRKLKLSTPSNEIQSTTKETHKRTITSINTAQPTSNTTLMEGCGVLQLFTSTYMILISEFFIINLIIIIIIYTIIDKFKTIQLPGMTETSARTSE